MTNENFYVYLHRDKSDQIFYVGKGTGDRAWSDRRHPAWLKYVSEKLKGEFRVEIFKNNLSEQDALDLENTLINQHGRDLVNWLNPKRDFDYDALKSFHEKRDANRLFIAETKKLESSDPEQAIERYKRALNVIREYESLTLERGLIADLDIGPNWGDPNILDRLTLCLIKEKMFNEAILETEAYFRDFPSALNLSIGKRINARIDKLKNRMRIGDNILS